MPLCADRCLIKAAESPQKPVSLCNLTTLHCNSAFDLLAAKPGFHLRGKIIIIVAREQKMCHFFFFIRMLCLQSEKAKNVTGCPVVRDMCAHAHMHSSSHKIPLNFIRDCGKESECFLEEMTLRRPICRRYTDG